MVAKPSRPEMQTVRCTHCDCPIEIPVQAMSVNCRHCHQRVVIEDVVIKSYHAVVRIATAGKVQVAKNATVVATGVRVRELEVKGTVKGDVIATERVSLTKKARIDGDVSCRCLSVQLGAQLVGYYTVTPDYVPPRPNDESD